MEHVEQVNLFDLIDVQQNPKPVVLNGMYYEQATGKYVSFVCGRRHYEIPAKGCGLNREWQERTKRFRAI
ncbi:hypothetical protein [Paenibacillus sp. IHBB 3054]|uniref:hypothetical protein n=1 Tax=Paenibacillus sp. IHBB 3054 TaxID=3425689 RepID=UPI003F664F08